MRWPFISRRERHRREASEWLARLNGPYDERDRAAFERWYRACPDHAHAYDHVAAVFEAAGKLRRPHASDAGADAPRRRIGAPLRYAVAAAAVGVILLAFVLLSARTTSPLTDPSQQFAAFAAEGERRRIELADGSEVLLAPRSALEVALGSAERRLHLVRGEASFSVAHERRPFIVVAQSTEVVARGTRFVVRLAGDTTTVSLIEGQVDVFHPASGPADRRRVTRLRPGERLVLDLPRDRPAAAVAAQHPQARQSPVRAAMLEFDDTPLRDAVEQVNRHAATQIRLAPSLGGLRVTGAFRAGDARGFAESVAAAFGIEVEQARDGNLSLRPREAAASD